MGVLFVIAVIGGAASVLTPCVLPLLPALLAVSGVGGRRRVFGLVIGIEGSFFILGLVLASILSRVGLPDDALQWLAAGMLVAFAAVLLIPPLRDRFSAFTSRLGSRVSSAPSGNDGFRSGLLAGIPLGIVWAPCAGPILAGISVAAATTDYTSETLVLMGGYSLGMLGPLTAVVFGGQRLGMWLRSRLKSGVLIGPAMGVILLATAVLIATGSLNHVNRFLAEKINLTSTPTAALEQQALNLGKVTGAEGEQGEAVDPTRFSATGYPERSQLTDLGRVPELEGITNWYNTQGEALSLGGLRGKVVLVDFWTYSCINCIRTLPYLKDWDAKYAGQGLVVLGVHTPEFQFEKNPSNVGKAVRDFDIEYPVALDPEFETWNNFYNRYWPAKYLIDRDGIVRYAHYGEGKYSQTENHIRTLLALPVTDEEDVSEARARTTPEIYLGYQRARSFVGSVGGDPGILRDQQATYSLAVPQLPQSTWSYVGDWTVTSENAVAGANAEIVLRAVASEVFIVAGGSNDGTIRASVDSQPQSVLAIDSHKLYTIRDAGYADSVIRLQVSPGVRVYSFTFG